MNNNLDQLGPIGFQDLAAALAVAEFGAGVQVMGDGRDGGRDMYHRGPLVWNRQQDLRGEVWDGYTVMQVKHMATPSHRHEDNVAWLWQQIREELDSWADPGKRRNPVAQYLLFITNVQLTPYPEAGGHDVINANIANYRERLKDDSRDVDREAKSRRKARLGRVEQIRKIRVWDGHQVKTLLVAHPGVRNAVNGFLTAGDVFAALPQLTGSIPVEGLEAGLRAHARTALTGEGYIYFDEAGSGDGTGIPVHEVAIDLPVTYADGSQRTNVVNYVLNRAEHILRPDVTPLPGPRHLIITGAPGNGKTTICKFLVQVFRAAMLKDIEEIGDSHRGFISGAQAALRRFRREMPRHRRWPMRIDLAQYAQEGGLDEDSTLLRWIADKVSQRSNTGDVRPWILKAWMQQWPWLLVLDGLDEVTEPAVRRRLIERVTEFVHEAEADNCDLLAVLTTRPVGYTENIAPDHFERIDLDYLKLAEAVAYGELATRVRLRTDLDRIDRVRDRLRKAAADEALQHLLRTPLQVLILTIIIDSSGQLAPDRYSLFWGYYDTVFRRERSKPGGLHQILQDHGQQIQQLHERVGFELQVRSETGERANATLTAYELKQIAWQILDEAGFDPSGKDAILLDKILQTATRRLVLLAPRSEPGAEDGLGFDVRSLQELMAGMHLTIGPFEGVIHRLRIAAASPFWRNTWLFAAGQLFAVPRTYQQQALVDLVESIDDDAAWRLGHFVPVGPRLALEIVDDGMVRAYPKWRDRLVLHGMTVLQENDPPDLSAIVRYLVRFASSGEDQQHIVAEGLRTALAGSASAAATAAAFQALVPVVVHDVDARRSVRGLASVKGPVSAVRPSTPADSWEDFEAEILTYPCTGESLRLLDRGAEALRQIRTGTVREEDIGALEEALRVGEVAEALMAALSHVAEQAHELIMYLRDKVVPAVHRQPIGEQLRGLQA